MRTVIAAATVAFSMLLGTAWAHDNSMPAQKGPNNPAVNTTGANNSPMPVAGSNSFTAGEAKSRLQKRGYSHISGLRKDANGVWRGKARHHGHYVPVSIDFQGNVN